MVDNAQKSSITPNATPTLGPTLSAAEGLVCSRMWGRSWRAQKRKEGRQSRSTSGMGTARWNGDLGGLGRVPGCSYGLALLDGVSKEIDS